MGKKWYESKTIWANVLATGAIILQTATGKNILPVDQQMIILSVINLVLRAITKDNITW